MIESILSTITLLCLGSVLIAFGCMRLTMTYYRKMVGYQKLMSDIVHFPLKPRTGDWYCSHHPEDGTRLDYQWDGERWNRT